MAGRIRTLKPEFWVDPKIVGLSPYARLLFQGIWNFADDAGVIEDEPLQLKLQVLPADPVDCESLLDELIKADLVRRAVNDVGKRLLVVRNWHHQKISKPSRPRHGDPATFHYPSGRTPGGLPEDSRTDREREGEGDREELLRADADAPDATAVDELVASESVPTAPLTGWTYSRTLGTWAEGNGMPCPQNATARSSVSLWLLDVLHRKLPAGTEQQRTTGRNLASKVVADYLADVTGAPLQKDGWALLGRHLREVGSVSTLRSIAVACEAGAGLSPPYDTDPLALFKYAIKVRNGDGK